MFHALQHNGKKLRYTEKLKAYCKSKALDRRITYKVFYPEVLIAGKTYPLLILNDGQESGSIKIKETLELLTGENLIEPIIVAGVYAGERMQEYGIAQQGDYAGRGSKAGLYTRFLLHEFIPHLGTWLPVSEKSSHNSIAGYSLGALSAFDIAWNNSDHFGNVGCFSGSFWWRTREWKKGRNVDRFRIAHDIVRTTENAPASLKFWFQTGTLDEKSDRNGNGVIDSIDDTLDLIKELEKQNILNGERIKYLEIEGGKHHPETWAIAMKDFLVWAYGNKTRNQ
ncbi:MAG: esterase family protein [Bacteroidales bacterium]|nr:esterase family protein [Bacteroidales bacterium]